MTELTVGFVGLGNMGWPMAANLHAAGFSLVVRDADAARQARFAAEHPEALTADSPAAFAVADIVVTMLPNGGIVRDALLGWGIATVLRSGALVVEMSSSDPVRHAPAGGRPRPGRHPGGGRAGVRRRARAPSVGELSLMVGGEDADVDRAQPVLRVLGDRARQFRTGGLGTGHAMKALNNVIGAATYCATAEALVIGQRFGLDPQTMIAIINASTGRSFVSELVFGPEVLTGRYLTGFALGLMAKDVRIAHSVAAAAGDRRPDDRARGRALGQGARPVRPRRRPVHGLTRPGGMTAWGSRSNPQTGTKRD